MEKILILYGSGRAHGNTEQLVKKVVGELSVHEVHLRELSILPIEDKRHDPEGFSRRDDDYQELITEALKYDIWIFATPIYWYGMSGAMKNFVDRWSQSLRDETINFKEEMAKKTAYAVLVGGDHPRVKGLPLIQQFQYICDFVKLSFGGYVIGKAGKPGEILEDERALRDAEQLHQLIKKNH